MTMASMLSMKCFVDVMICSHPSVSMEDAVFDEQVCSTLQNRTSVEDSVQNELEEADGRLHVTKQLCEFIHTLTKDRKQKMEEEKSSHKTKIEVIPQQLNDALEKRESIENNVLIDESKPMESCGLRSVKIFCYESLFK